MGGLVGAAEQKVATAIFGLDNRATGKDTSREKRCRWKCQRAMRRESLSCRRTANGPVLLGMSILDNTSLAHIDYFSAGGFVDRKARLAEVRS